MFGLGLVVLGESARAVRRHVTARREALELLGVWAFALFVRLAVAPVGIVNGNLAGYEKLIMAHGAIASPPYGEGWGAIMGRVPGWPDGVFAANLVLATFAAPLLVAIVD